MENVSLSLDEEVLSWARGRAAERGASLVQFVAELLREQMAEEQSYESAMKRYLSRKPARISQAGDYPPREELHDRPGLRR